MALLRVSDVELLRLVKIAAARFPGSLVRFPLLAPFHGQHVQDVRTIRRVRACEAGGGGRASSLEVPLMAQAESIAAPCGGRA